MFLGLYICVVSVALRLPTAYRSGTGSGQGRKEDGRIEGLGGSRDVGEMSLGEKVVVVIKTEC